MAIISNFKLPSKEVVLELVNKTQSPNTALTFQDVKFSAPEQVGTDETTKIIITPETGSTYIGSSEATYKRVIMSTAVNTLTIEYTDGMTFAQFVEALNIALGGSKLVVGEDIIDNGPPIPGDEQEYTDFEVTAAEGSYVWFGKGVVKIHDKDYRNLERVIKEGELDGLVFTAP